MQAHSFWLVTIDESTVNVSLLTSSNDKYSIAALGPHKNWSSSKEDSLTIATDESLSLAANESNLSEEDEPSSAAFVVPSFWVGSDGKIILTKLKLIENLCKSLRLQPIGFISHDEAIVEEANMSDGFPASFILLYLGTNEFILSLIYLGRIKERVKDSFEGEINPRQVESALLELKTESTLPPQIIVFGHADAEILHTLKNYSWIGKKDIETFLHFPEIKMYSEEKAIEIYSKIIASQINPTPIDNKKYTTEDLVTPEIVDEEDETVDNLETDPAVEDETEEKTINSAVIENDIKPEKDLDEVSPSELGFQETVNFPQEQKVPLINSIQELGIEPQLFDPLPTKIETVANKISYKKPKISFEFLKKIKLKKTKFSRFLFLPLAISPILLLIPFLFSKAKVTIFVTPYTFNKQLPVTLDTNTESIDQTRGVIPVVKKIFTITSSASTPTTGKKTVGEKAQGEIVIYNKLDKVQNLPRGTVITDSEGHKFELPSTVSIAPSSSDLDEGVITLGQTKTVIVATDIGTEFNINKDIKLKFKDYAESVLIAKTKEVFTGGSKQEINAVGEQDKKTLDQKINETINDSIKTKTENELSGISGIIQETIQSRKDKIDYSREVGEEADELIANAEATVSVFVLNPESKSNIINTFLSSEPDFAQADIDPRAFQISYQIDKIDVDKAKGTITINGKALPIIDIVQFKKTLSGKTIKKASLLIKTNIQRAYNYNIKTNLQLIKAINPLPFKPENITIDVQSETL